MKDILNDIIGKYLYTYPNEVERQKVLFEFINNNEEKLLTDWNNFNGHLVASAFVYVEDQNKFLVLYHKDLDMYLYPGGHMNSSDTNPMEAAIREFKEETGLANYSIIASPPMVPFDIDTHMISRTERLNLPAHLHFDFRYLFCVPTLTEVQIDKEEHSDYKLVGIEELKFHQDNDAIISKLKKLLNINA